MALDEGFRVMSIFLLLEKCKSLILGFSWSHFNDKSHLCFFLIFFAHIGGHIGT